MDFHRRIAGGCGHGILLANPQTADAITARIVSCCLSDHTTGIVFKRYCHPRIRARDEARDAGRRRDSRVSRRAVRRHTAKNSAPYFGSSAIALEGINLPVRIAGRRAQLDLIIAGRDLNSQLEPAR